MPFFILIPFLIPDLLIKLFKLIILVNILLSFINLTYLFILFINSLLITVLNISSNIVNNIKALFIFNHNYILFKGFNIKVINKLVINKPVINKPVINITAIIKLKDKTKDINIYI